MSTTTTISPRIIESLYGEALALSDEVRVAFDLSDDAKTAAIEDDAARIALSCEALRTTTRMMHAIAWLLNHRAYFTGELSEFQLRRRGRLASDYPGSDQDRLALLQPEMRALIATTERFYARLARIDRTWRDGDRESQGAVERLRQRLKAAVAS